LASRIEQVPPPNLQPPQGIVVWLTGLSGAGKSTIASAAAAVLARRGTPVEILDGDLLRKSLSKDLGFSKADRDKNVAWAGFVANLLSRRGAIVFVALVSPYAEARNTVRARVRRFIEVYVNAPLTVCEQRDPKGLYRLARRGELPAFTGVSDPYEPPAAPEVECHTDRESLEESVGKVLAAVYGIPEQRVPARREPAAQRVQCVRS
jgi:adenylylsulfate kinase